MSVSFRPPTATAYEVKYRQRGVVPWAVQRALNTIENPHWGPVMQDGIFGAKTKKAVIGFQIERGLVQDGVVGPRTSMEMAQRLMANSSLAIYKLPEGLLRGLVEGESGGLIGAVNTSVAGGIDCGYCQRRVYSADYDTPAVVKRAFDGVYQIKLLAKTLRQRHDSNFGKTGARTHAMAWKLAALYHNYPSAALAIANYGINGLSDYYTTPQAWVEAVGVVFPISKKPVRTPLEWCQFYALGTKTDPGYMTQYVGLWTP